MIRTVTKSILLTCFLLACATSRGASFTPLGDLPGGAFRSEAHGVSYDGSVVVGRGTIAGRTQGFRWTQSGGMSPLPDGVFVNTFATDISENGLVISGIIGNSGGVQWTQSEGMTAVRGGGAYGLSHDGSVMVGGNYRWTNATGSVFLPLSIAKGVSADGSVVAGSFGNGGVTYAARWTEATGPVSLGALPATNIQSFASEISADGSVIVGGSNTGTANDRVAFRWTQSGGMVGLGDLPGGSVQSIAYDVSADGSVVVGTSDSGIPDSFVWTAASGMLNLRDVLAAGGATGFENWTSLYAFGISGDGSTVVGYGRNPNGQDEAFVANIVVPEPAAVSIAMFGVGAFAARRRRAPLACRQRVAHSDLLTVRLASSLRNKAASCVGFRAILYPYRVSQQKLQRINTSRLLKSATRCCSVQMDISPLQGNPAGSDDRPLFENLLEPARWPSAMNCDGSEGGTRRVDQVDSKTPVLAKITWPTRPTRSLRDLLQADRWRRWSRWRR